MVTSILYSFEKRESSKNIEKFVSGSGRRGGRVAGRCSMWWVKRRNYQLEEGLDKSRKGIVTA